jgi:hypothetical protein
LISLPNTSLQLQRESPAPRWSCKLVELLLQSWFGGAGALPNTPLTACFNWLKGVRVVNTLNEKRFFIRDYTIYQRHSQRTLEMAMGTQNPSTRRVLPDKETYFYPRVHKWATSCTHRVSGCGCGYILPIPAYPRVK